MNKQSKGSAESDAEFFRRLNREFTVERWDAIFSELHRALSKYLTSSQAQTRMAELLDALNEQPPPADLTAGEVDTIRLGMAWSQTAAEASLIAVALYLARHERPTGPAET